MAALANPALAAFVAAIQEERVVAQVLVRRLERGYELRHVEDKTAAAHELRLIQPGALRSLAQFTAAGAFRPLKTAPNLQRRWRSEPSDDQALATALDGLYPGAIADWFAAQSASPPVTPFHEFTRRQTGMYRLTAMLDEAQAARVIRTGCHREFCLKRRLWTAEGLGPDAAGDKSIIPCLEPCAVLLEFARQAMRLEQEQRRPLELAPGEAASLLAALRSALANPEAGLREADFRAPANPRRLRLLLERLEALAQVPRQITPCHDSPDEP